MSFYSSLTRRAGRISSAQRSTRTSNAVVSIGSSVRRALPQQECHGTSSLCCTLHQWRGITTSSEPLLVDLRNTPSHSWVAGSSPTSSPPPLSPRSSTLPTNGLLLETRPWSLPVSFLGTRSSIRPTSRYCNWTPTIRSFSGEAEGVLKKKKKTRVRRSKGGASKGKSSNDSSEKPTSRGRKKKNTVDPHQLKGPRGRPVMTEERYFEDDILQNTLNLSHFSHEKNNPKAVLHEAKVHLGFELNLKHQAVQEGSQPLFSATMTSTFTHGDLEKYGQDHEHVVHRSESIVDDCSDSAAESATTTTTSELICVGVAGSKKKAEALAAADTIALLYEIGISCRDPPKLKGNRLEAARERSKALLKASLARAQMVLELVGCSRPLFTTVEGTKRVNGNSTWKSTASCFVRRHAISATSEEEVAKKADAESHALIALAKCEELKNIVGSDALETYERLIDDSPGKQVASLVVPPIPDDLIDDVADAIGTQSDHELRISRHFLAKDQYEYSLAERREGSSRSKRIRRPQSNLSDSVKKNTNDAFQKEEAERAEKAVKNPDGKEAAMLSVRDALPIKAIREELIDALRTEQIVVVSGGTGSGKSTQCPQYILEAAIAEGKAADTRIIVTQPRRIAAVSVSERVAAERNEKIGNSIGYTVRFKREAARDYGGSIEFVTTGVLLRRLINEPTLADVSHIMIDEVHERDINTDFLLVLLRDLMESRPDLKVILMSATLDAESFSDYFARGKSDAKRAPLLSVPTQPRHPVELFYLEDLADSSDTSHFPEGAAKLAQTLLQNNDAQLKIDLEEALAEEKAAEELQALSLAEDDGESFDRELDSDSDSDSDSDPLDSITAKSRVKTLKKALSLRDPDGLLPDRKTDEKLARTTMVDLTVKVAQHLSEEELDAGRSGSILCFLPGWDEIKIATEEMEKTKSSLRKNILVLPLHSSIPHEDQQKVFEPALGKVKVILATNIAESSVTIPDVLAVIDSGLVRELNYDAESAMSSMDTSQTSRASATQRLGRAGRVAPGKCYRLYSRGDFEAMSARPTPEIQRTALESTCLQTCSMTTKTVEEFLSQALDPPPKESVAHAMNRLIQLRAISENDDGAQTLTPLGRFLSRLPLDPATGRMLIMGVVMQCLEPLLTTAASFSSRSVFYNPPGRRDEAQNIRRSLADTSDIMATINAYNTFWSICDEEGWPQAKNWAFDNFVSISAMSSIKQVSSQLLEELKRTGLVSPYDLERRSRKPILRRDADVNKNADHEKLYTAIWASAFPGNLASRRPLASFGTLRTRLDEHAGLHPSSVMFLRKPQIGKRQPHWYLYREMVLSSQIFIREATSMDPSQILLFGGYSHEPVKNDLGNSRMRGVLDDWIVVEGSCSESVDYLIRAREDINMALERKVMFPKASLPEDTQEILDIVCDVLDPGADEDEYD